MLVVCENCEGTGKVVSDLTDFEGTPIMLDCGICFGTGCVEEEEIDTPSNAEYNI